MILTDVSDTINADSSLALFALNIESLLADVTNSENSYFDLTCDVISDLQVKFLTLFG